MTASLIDWLNNNAAAIQALATIALVVITFLYARSVKAHVEQDRALFDLQRQDLQARRREADLETTEQIIIELCENYQIEWDDSGPKRMAVSHYMADATTLTNIGADPKTLQALDQAYKAIRKYNKQIPSFKHQRTEVENSYKMAHCRITAALNTLLADPKTSNIAVRFKEIISS